MNAQNQLVRNQVEAVSAALTHLSGLGITVLSVHIGERAKPVIEVQQSGACARLESGIYMIINCGTERLHERVALVCNCQVRWRQRAAP